MVDRYPVQNERLKTSISDTVAHTSSGAVSPIQCFLIELQVEIKPVPRFRESMGGFGDLMSCYDVGARSIY